MTRRAAAAASIVALALVAGAGTNGGGPETSVSPTSRTRRPRRRRPRRRFIEDNRRLRPDLTGRDRGATPLLSAFDFSQPPQPPDPLPLRTDRTGPKFPEA